MNLKSAKWYPIAAGLSGINLIAGAFAAGQGEPTHAAIHVALAVGFGFWAQNLRSSPDGRELPARLEALEIEVDKLRLELSETQERLDFTERLLAQLPETRRMGPDR